MTHDASTRWSPPAQFDGFMLLRPIGQGGMGRVYLAREDSLDRNVAIKLIAEELEQPDARRRFMREARALARVEHPNVVRIYRLGTVLGRPYIVYEVVSGDPLDRLPASRDCWRTAIHVGRGLAQGLVAVHRAGVLHRDLKPSNVMLTRDGVVKLLDFGLASLSSGSADHGAAPAGDSGAPDARSGDDELTVTLPVRAGTFAPVSDAQTRGSAMMGTPRYMAPELWGGARASEASDLHAVGLILYELCGVAIARGEDRSIPSLGAVHDEVPRELVAIVDRLLDPDPAARFESAEALQRALERAPLSGRRVPATTALLHASTSTPSVDTPEPSEESGSIRGADNTVDKCLGARAGETVVIAYWRAREEAALLAAAAARLGARGVEVDLEDGSAGAVEAALARADRSLLVARHGLPPELFRAVLDVVQRRQLVHLFLTRADRRLFTQSYRADPHLIAQLNERIAAALREANALQLTAPSGTSLRVGLSQRHPVLTAEGRPVPGRPENWPAGYVGCHSTEIDGVFVADRHMLGAARFGRDSVSRAPVRFRLAEGRVRDVACDDEDVREKVRAYLGSHVNAGRVGTLAIATNHLARIESGMEIQDSLLPGMSLVLGYSDAEHSGARFTCPVQLRLFGRRQTLQIERGPVLVDCGRFAEGWVRGIDPFR